MSAAWPTARLGDVLTPSVRAHAVDPSRQYALLGVRLDGQGPFHRETVLGTQTSASRLYEVRSGDFIYSRLFAWRGAFGLIEPEFDGHFVSNEFPTFTAINGRVEPKFLRYWFRLPDVLRRVEADCSGSTPLTRNRFKEQYFFGLEIPLPPLDEQRRIVARIEELAAKVEEALRLRHGAVEELTALGNSEANAIFGRADYTTRPLGDLCHVITDGTHQTPRYVDEGAIFLSAQNVKPFRFLPEVHRKVSFEDYAVYTAKNKPSRGDILLTRVGAGIGEAAVIDQDIDFAIYVSVALIRPDASQITPQFLVHWLNSPIGRSHSRSKTLGRGHSQGNLNLNLLRSFPVPVPPITRQNEIVSELDALQAKVDAVKALHTETAVELDAMLPAILDKAFKGEL